MAACAWCERKWQTESVTAGKSMIYEYKIICEKGRIMSRKRNVARRSFRCVIAVLMMAVVVVTGGMTSVFAGEKRVSNPKKGQYTNETTYDCVWFGRYPQSDKYGRTYEPIKWRVLSVSGNDMLLMSDQILDCRPFATYVTDRNDNDVTVTWKNSDIRKWLNNDFMKKAFNQKERNAIKKTQVKTRKDVPATRSSGSAKVITTYDRVYLLSAREARVEKYGFAEYVGDARGAKGTRYAKGKNLYVNDNSLCYGWGSWWLRDSGYYDNDASCVDSWGSINNAPGNDHAAESDIGVRPVIHIKKSSKLWKYAGTVRLDGTVKEVNKPKSITKAGWVKRNNRYVYLDSAGRKLRKSAGWYKINDKYIKLSASGKRLNVNRGWYKVGGRYYLLGRSGERIQRGAGWHKIGKRYYYLRDNGVRVVRPSGWYKVDDCYYYIKSNGIRVKKTGWGKVGNRYYYIDSNGCRETRWSDWYKVGDRMYYISYTGRRISKKAGFITSWGYTYYVRSDGSLLHGWKRIKGKKYYFDKNGRLAGTSVAYSYKYKALIYRFKTGKTTWYQSIGMGAVKDQSASMFAKVRKKYPDMSVFEGMGNADLDQCDIFAYTVGEMNTGVYPRENWEITYDIDSVKCGDIIKYSSGKDSVHFVTVTGVYGDCIQYMDANGAGDYRHKGVDFVRNTVLWDQWATKTDFKKVFIFALVKP